MTPALARALAAAQDLVGREARQVADKAAQIIDAVLDSLLGLAGRAWNRRAVRWCERTIRAWLRVLVWGKVDSPRGRRLARLWRRRFDRRVVWALAAPPVRVQMPDRVRVATPRQILAEAGVPALWLPG